MKQALLLAFAFAAQPLLAQQAALPVVTATEDEATLPDLLDGTLSVQGDLEEDSTPQTTITNAQPSLPPWFAFKQRFEQRTVSVVRTFGADRGVD